MIRFDEVTEDVESMLMKLRNKSLIANFDLDPDADHIELINDSQRSKIHVMIREFAEQYGEDEEDMKRDLMDWFGHGDFSLSNCSSSLANKFIEFIIKKSNEAGYEVEQEDVFCKQAYRAIQTKTCVVCNDTGKVYQNSHGKQICVCDMHKQELDINPVGFMDKYHIQLI